MELARLLSISTRTESLLVGYSLKLFLAAHLPQEIFEDVFPSIISYLAKTSEIIGYISGWNSELFVDIPTSFILI